MTKLDPADCIYSEIDAVEVGPFGMVPYYRCSAEYGVGCCLNLMEYTCDLYRAKIEHEQDDKIS